MKYQVIIKAHHKTGTNWMGSIFQGLADALDIKYIHLSRMPSIEDRRAALSKVAEGDEKVILFHPYGWLPKIRLVHRSQFRGMHLIRDPRDLILSSAKYHTWSEEKWLHEPMEEFGGKTYQQQLNSLETVDERIEFEMKNSAKKNIEAMHTFDKQNVFFNVKFEDLRQDLDLMLWHRILLRLGFEAPEIPKALELFINHSIQFGRIGKNTHIQDRSILPWVSKFPRSKLAYFDEHFGKITKDLGYARTSDVVSAPEDKQRAVAGQTVF